MHIPDETRTEDAGGRLVHNFAAERQAQDVNLFESVVNLLKREGKKRRHTVIACWSDGSRDRMAQLLQDHGLRHPRTAENWQDAITTVAGGHARWSCCRSRTASRPTTSSSSPSRTFSANGCCGRSGGRRRRDALTEATSLAAGDLVVHVDHGIGRFLGLKQIEAMRRAARLRRDPICQRQKLYLPVENIELLSRYGSDGSDIELDKLGGVAWQAKKASSRSASATWRSS